MTLPNLGVHRALDAEGEVLLLPAHAHHPVQKQAEETDHRVGRNAIWQPLVDGAISTSPTAAPPPNISNLLSTLRVQISP